MKDAETGLTPFQLKFAQLAAKGLKDIESYKQAGYSQKQSNNSMRVSAYKLLRNSKISAVIEQIKAKVAENVIKANVLTKEQAYEDILYGIKLCKERNNMSALARYVELECKCLALLTDNLNTADITKQRELEADEAAEAKRIATIRLAEFAEESLKVG